MKVLLLVILLACSSCSTILVPEYQSDIRDMEPPKRGSDEVVEVKEGPEAYRVFVNLVRAPFAALISVIALGSYM
jgi:hypothetical protein